MCSGTCRKTHNFDSSDLRRPFVRPAFAGKLAEKFYNFGRITEIKEYGSYYDRNFYIRGQRSNSYSSQDHQTETALEEGEYVLKILNSDDSKRGDFVDEENEAMKFLRERDFPCALVYPVDGGSDLKLHVQIPICSDRMDGAISDVNRNVQETEECIIRLVSFLPGETAASLGKLSHDNLFCIGQFVGKLSKALQDFQSPVLSQKVDRWDTENFLWVEEYIPFVKDEEIHSLVGEVLGRFKTHVTPKLSLLRRGILHNDIAQTNLLIDTSEGTFKISGVIDFGDVRHSCLLFEIAITVASFINTDDVLAGSGHLIAGYQAVFPLPDLEFELLYDIVSARLCQVFVITSKEESDNLDNEYLRSTLEVYLANIKAWLKHSRDEVIKYWRKIGLNS